jgi:hypothetical protein
MQDIQSEGSAAYIRDKDADSWWYGGAGAPR